MPSAAKAKREAAKAEKASQKSSQSIATTATASQACPNVQLIFPSILTARQRAILHAVGEQYGLPHSSSGEGDDRKLTLGTAHDDSSIINLANEGIGGGNETLNVSTAATATAAVIDDSIIISLLEKHLKKDATPIFNEKNQPSAANTQSGKNNSNKTFPASAASASGKNISNNGSKRIDMSQFISSMETLVELERRAEVAAAEESLSSATPEQAQAKGRALLNLRLEGAEGGLLGRTLLTLVRNKVGSSGEESLPPHKFSPHDIVRIRAAKGDGSGGGREVLAQGVVYRVKETSITVAVDDYPDEGLDVPLKLEKLANEVTYDRLKLALKSLQRVGNDGQGPAGPLVEVLFSGREPQFTTNHRNDTKINKMNQDVSTLWENESEMEDNRTAQKQQWSPINKNLDDSQKAAVNLALSAVDIALIQGPPGTGKTTTVVEIIMQEVARGSRVLACAASNIAVDNLVERIAAQKTSKSKGSGGSGSKSSTATKSTNINSNSSVNVVRVGHPARLLPAVLDSSLEAKVLSSDDSALAKDCRKEIKDLNSRLLKLGRRDRAERTSIRKELRKLAKEERQRQQKAITTVLNNASVICATLTGVGSRQLEKLPPFDVVVIDEAAQALEPACWAALLRGRRTILAGDHLQLPPTVTSEEAARKGLSLTLFERAHSLWGHIAAVMLTVQYRMNVSIMKWSSEEMYNGKISAHASVAGHTLLDLLPSNLKNTEEEESGGTKNTSTENSSDISSLPVLLLIDTAGCDMEEEIEEGGESKLNRGEAEVAIAHVQRLLDLGIKPSDIGVITPYAAQVGALRELRSEKLKLPVPSFSSSTSQKVKNSAGNGGNTSNNNSAGVQAVEISTVDGFQGREKEAIIISMVRSNTSGEVGFLADNRRMNVAVTRARRQCVLVCDSDTVKNDPFLNRLRAYFEEQGEYASAQEYIE